MQAAMALAEASGYAVLETNRASDAETLEHEQALLTHADAKLTQRIYRRKPERVRPLR